MSINDGIDVCSECECYHCDDLICGECLKEKIKALKKEIRKQKWNVWDVASSEMKELMKIIDKHFKQKKNKSCE